MPESATRTSLKVMIGKDLSAVETEVRCEIQVGSNSR